MGYNTIPCNPYPISTEELNKGNNDELNIRVTELESDVSDLDSNKANKVDIATEFSNLTNYNVGDLVYYDGALYEFQVDHTAGAWETSEVIQKDLSDIVTTLKSGLTNLTPTLSNISITASGGTSGFLDALLAYVKECNMLGQTCYTLAGVWYNTATFVGYAERSSRVYYITVSVTDKMYYVYDNGTTVYKKLITSTDVS